MDHLLSRENRRRKAFRRYDRRLIAGQSSFSNECSWTAIWHFQVDSVLQRIWGITLYDKGFQ